jgi:hypothetical protein
LRFWNKQKNELIIQIIHKQLSLSFLLVPEVQKKYFDKNKYFRTLETSKKQKKHPNNPQANNIIFFACSKTATKY